jgi:cyclophilin family peptidyl-prolyl cis-trans isomerase
MPARSDLPELRPMTGRRQLALVPLVALALMLVACGSDESDPNEPTPVEVSAAADADIESNCWSEEDRSSEGSPDMPNQQQWSSPPEMQIDPAGSYVATMNTSEGTFKIELLPAEAPKTVNNFVCLAKAGYFDNTPFHRIISGFVVQGGDPTGTGSGGPGYRFEDEPVNLDYLKGTVAMANAGPNTNGSQFFVVLDDLRGKLQKNYTIFGQVSEGMDVVEKLGAVPTTSSARGERSVPVEPVTLESVTIDESTS